MVTSLIRIEVIGICTSGTPIPIYHGVNTPQRERHSPSGVPEQTSLLLSRDAARSEWMIPRHWHQQRRRRYWPRLVPGDQTLSSLCWHSASNVPSFPHLGWGREGGKCQWPHSFSLTRAGRAQCPPRSLWPRRGLLRPPCKGGPPDRPPIWQWSGWCGSWRGWRLHGPRRKGARSTLRISRRKADWGG